MINHAVIFAGILNAYGLMNLLAAILCSAAFVHVYMRSRHLLMRPSLILAGLMNIFFQWPLAAYAGYYGDWLPRPLDMAYIVHAPVLIALTMAALMPDRSLKDAWGRLPGCMLATISTRAVMGMFAILGGIVALLAGLYFSYVPFHCTGLYAMFTDLYNVAVYREISLKELVDMPPRYALSLLSSAVVPVFCMLCAIKIKSSIRLRFWHLVAFSVVLFVAALPFAVINGAKGYLVTLFLQVGLVFIWQARVPLNLRSVALVTIMPLLPAILFMIAVGQAKPLPEAESQARIASCQSKMNLAAKLEPLAVDPMGQAMQMATKGFMLDPRGQPITELDIILGNINAVFFRVLAAPLMAGSWHVHYVQTEGYVGVHGIERVARLFHVSHTNMPNVVAIKYAPVYFGHEVMPSITANVGFPFANYSYFGLWGIGMALGFLLLLDMGILLFRFLSDFMLAPYMAVLSLGALRLIQTDFSVVCVSHGMGLSVALLIMAQLYIRYADKKKVTQ